MMLIVDAVRCQKAIRCCLFAAVSVTLWMQAVHAQSGQEAGREHSEQVKVERDGQHDFDFSIGSWRTHIQRRLHPLSGSNNWMEFEGTSMVRKIWNGHASLGETEADGQTGHIEVLSLRLYNPEAHQWNLSYANSAAGSLSVPPSVGEFKNGRGEFFDSEPFNSRNILVRQVWSDITPNSCRFEQSFSDDGGKTWEVNWIAVDTRIPEAELPKSRK